MKTRVLWQRWKPSCATLKMLDTVAIVGVGMIGGSVAAALRDRNLAATIHGFDANPTHLSSALAAGLIDAAPTGRVAADLVVLAVPGLSVEAVLRELARAFANGTVVTDVLSVKQPVLRGASEALGAVPETLVPGHPIAGSEQRGPDAADPDLFVDHRVILTPTATTRDTATATVKGMWEAIGAKVVLMEAARHDQVLACTSHLPHLLAYALGDSLSKLEDSAEVFRFAAGGFRDFTRIAGSDPVMWRDIFASNRTALLDVLDQFTADLANLRGLIERDAQSEVFAVLDEARMTREALSAHLEGENSEE